MAFVLPDSVLAVVKDLPWKQARPFYVLSAISAGSKYREGRISTRRLEEHTLMTRRTLAKDIAWLVAHNVIGWEPGYSTPSRNGEKRIEACGYVTQMTTMIPWRYYTSIPESAYISLDKHHQRWTRLLAEYSERSRRRSTNPKTTAHRGTTSFLQSLALQESNTKSSLSNVLPLEDITTRRFSAISANSERQLCEEQVQELDDHPWPARPVEDQGQRLWGQGSTSDCGAIVQTMRAA